MCGSDLAALAPCSDDGYRLLLENGISNGGRYIEVLPSNVEPFRNALAAVQSELRSLPR